MHRVVTPAAAAPRAADRRQRQQRIERQLRERRSDPDAAKERRPQRSEQLQPGQRDVGPERIRDEIDLMAEITEGPDAVIFAERRATRLEERLWRDHQNAHGWGDFLTKP
jgi:hypothetical protein